jgi:UDP-N-acetylmuramyl pentapeptide synthase
VRAALGSRLRVHATIGNYNNLVGVPQDAVRPCPTTPTSR